MNSRNIRRKYGQNYLKDPSVLYKMASVISPQDSQNFLEIGPGYGALTEQLNLKNVNVIGVDVDSTNIEFLKNKFKGPANFKFVRENILEYKIHGHNHRIVGNLPYNISTQIILKLLNNYEQIIDMHFLVQKEVAEKITGQVGTKNWGKLGVKISAFFLWESSGEFIKIFTTSFCIAETTIDKSFTQISRACSSLAISKTASA